MRAWHGAVAGVSLITEPLHCRGGNSDAFFPPVRVCFIVVPSQVLSDLQERHQRGREGRREAQSQQEESEDALGNHGESEGLGEGDAQNTTTANVSLILQAESAFLPFPQ